MDLPAIRNELEACGLPVPGLPEAVPLPGDAGGRSYARIRAGDRGLLLMMLPERPDREGGDGGASEELPFLNVGRFLASRGLPVPRVFGHFPGTRRLYLEDFGPEHLSMRAKASGDPVSWYGRAVDLLREMQARTRAPDPGCVAFRRRFDVPGIRAELEEFAAFGLPHRLGRPPGEAGMRDLGAALDRLASEVAALPAVFSHRDFHADNLIVRPDGSLGIIDFQDAFLAPRPYDLASLLTDREAPGVLGPAGLAALLERWGGDPREFWLVALQRQLKVAGRFAILARRGKAGYLRYLPHTWGVLAEALPRSGSADLHGLLTGLGAFRS